MTNIDIDRQTNGRADIQINDRKKICFNRVNINCNFRSNSTSSRVEATIKTGGSLLRAGRKPGTGRGTGNRMSPVSILEYDQDKINKLDSHWRIQVSKSNVYLTQPKIRITNKKKTVLILIFYHNFWCWGQFEWSTSQKKLQRDPLFWR